MLDDFGRLGRSWREIDDEEAADFDALVSDLLDGQYSSPVRVVCFNTAEEWSRDVSGIVARELRRRCDIDGRELPAGVSDFVDENEGARQLTLRLA